jgi:hypothetical protein
MENQTRFDLNAAIEKWRQELAAQPNLADDERRELVMHLGDAIADFQKRGLNDEESFWLARRRVGHPQELAQEFVKANPTEIYRERVFWLAVGLLIYRMWNTLTSSFIGPLYSRFNPPAGDRLENVLPQWVAFYFPIWLQNLHFQSFIYLFLASINFSLVLAVLICVARGKLEKLRSMFEVAFNSRLRFVIIAMLSLFLVSVVSNLIYNSLSVNIFRRGYLVTYLAGAFWDSWIIAVIAWLMPSQNRSASQLA